MKAMENEYKIRLNQMKEDGTKIAVAQLNEIRKLTTKNYIIYGWCPQEVIKDQIDKQIKELEGE